MNKKTFYISITLLILVIIGLAVRLADTKALIGEQHELISTQHQLILELTK